MIEHTILTPEIMETPETKEVVSDVVEKKEHGKWTKDIVEKTKKEFLKADWLLSYKEIKKMEDEFKKTFLDLTPQWVLKTLQDNMPDIFKDTKNGDDALTILKEGKNGDDENLELGKNENLYDWLKEHIKKEKTKHLQELKEELEKEKNPIIENVVDNKKEQKENEKSRWKTDANRWWNWWKNKETPSEYKESESKLWKTTKKVLNRSLKHTWLSKYLVKKPIDWVKKLLKRK